MGTGINIKKKIAVQDESVTLTSDVNSINITGAGATATTVGNDVTINIPGGSGGGVTSVGLTAGTGISLSGTNPITSSGSITVTNAAPDQVVSLTAGTGIGVTGTYPNFTIDNTGALTDENIYNTDGTLTGPRFVTLDGNQVAFQDVAASPGAFSVNLSNGTGALTDFTLNIALFDIQRINSLGYGAAVTGTDTSLLLKFIGAGGNKQLELTNNGITVNAAYTLPNTDGTANQVLTTNGAGVASWSAQPEVIQAACSDETTNLTTGTAKVTFRMPYAMTLTEVRASLSTAQTAGALLTVDINLNGTSVLGTKLTFDNNEKTTVTAATPATIVTSALTDDGEITVDIDAVGTAGARGLKITLIGTRV